MKYLEIFCFAKTPCISTISITNQKACAAMLLRYFAVLWSNHGFVTLLHPNPCLSDLVRQKCLSPSLSINSDIFGPFRHLRPASDSKHRARSPDASGASAAAAAGPAGFCFAHPGLLSPVAQRITKVKCGCKNFSVASMPCNGFPQSQKSYS